MAHQVGDFLLQKQIGQGSFGQVFLATRLSNPSSPPYACKVIPRQRALDHFKSSDAVDKEIQLLKEANHPNVTQLIAHYRSKSSIYMFMEWCDVGDLQQFVAKRCSQGEKVPRLREEDAKIVIQQVVAGLKYLNAKNIIHRDVKVENILVKSFKSTPTEPFPYSSRSHLRGIPIDCFQFKIADLGLATSLSNSSDLRSTNCGTPIYMAPEVLEGKNYCAKVDIWALGALLFILLTGSHPFIGRNMRELQENLKKGSYKIPKDVQVSIECLDFLNCCLKFDSSKRCGIDALVGHPFVTQGVKQLRESKLARKVAQCLGRDAKESLQLNTRNSVNFFEIYEKVFRDHFYQRIDKFELRRSKLRPLNPIRTPKKPVVEKQAFWNKPFEGEKLFTRQENNLRLRQIMKERKPSDLGWLNQINAVLMMAIVLCLFFFYLH